jgi:hypothetical protein
MYYHDKKGSMKYYSLLDLVILFFSYSSIQLYKISHFKRDETCAWMESSLHVFSLHLPLIKCAWMEFSAKTS